MRIIGPGLKLSASFAGAMPQAGHVAFISIGNMLDVDFGDLID